MTDSLPDPKFQPDDVVEVIKNYRQPIGDERKAKLMNKLTEQKERLIQEQQEVSQDPHQDQGRKK